MGLIGEGAELALDGETLRAFLDVTDDLGINIEDLRYLNDLLSNLWTYVDFHTMTHIEYLIHLLPVCA